MKLETYLKNIPNVLTVLRILLVIPFVLALLQGAYQLALLLLLIAGTTDALDGFLARYFGWYSWFGSIADPVADKVLLIASYVVLGYLEQLPLWLVTLVVCRDLVIFTGALVVWLVTGPYKGQPSVLGKACTFVLIVFGVMTLVNLALFPLPVAFLQIGSWCVALLCVVSGIHYLYLGIQEVRGAWRNN